eukprot:2617618-Amphidinium_carterae.1
MLLSALMRPSAVILPAVIGVSHTSESETSDKHDQSEFDQNGNQTNAHIPSRFEISRDYMKRVCVCVCQQELFIIILVLST